jgi:hypothetical protein
MSRPLFDYHRPLAAELAQAHERIKAEVRAEPAGYVRDADAEQWAAHLAEKYAADPPVLVMTEMRVEDLGERQVDATNMPGVTYSLSELGQTVIRPGYEVRLVIPVLGDATLLRHAPAEGTPIVEADIERGAVVRHWAWPKQSGSEQLNQEINQVTGQTRDGAAKVADQVARHNSALGSFAAGVIEERRTELNDHSDFLSGLSVPVQRREDAPKPFSLPPIERRTPPNPLIPKPTPVSGPELGKFYNEILEVIRPMGRAMERTPADFAGRPEERLRDHLLVALNTQYRGQAGAEGFNKGGKTDLLLRVQDHNAFIGECKWWSGVKDMGRALDQLYGYSTWRDSRLALIFFVAARDPAAIVEKARELLAARDEFDGWESNDHEAEMRCRIRWPDDPGRTATLTSLFFHLPTEAE